MAKIEFIGNLGADARVETTNGRQFVAFNVADTDSYTDQDGNRHEVTQWISCTMAGDGGKLLPYLKKGKTVFVRGHLSTRIFNSAKHHKMMCGLNCAVKELDLVGGQVREMPRQLNDTNGVLFDIYTAYYINPQLAEKPTQLLDMQMQTYSVDANGFVTKDAADPTTPSDAQRDAGAKTPDHF